MIRELLSRLATLPVCGWYAVPIEPPPPPAAPHPFDAQPTVNTRRSTPREVTAPLGLHGTSTAH